MSDATNLLLTDNTIGLLYNRYPERQFRRHMGKYQTEGEYKTLRRLLERSWVGIPRDTNHPRNVYLDFDDSALYAVTHHRPKLQDMAGRYLSTARYSKMETVFGDWRDAFSDRRPTRHLAALVQHAEQDPRHLARHYPFLGSLGCGVQWLQGEKATAQHRHTIQTEARDHHLTVRVSNHQQPLAMAHVTGITTRHPFLQALRGEHTQVKQTFYHVIRYLNNIGVRPLYFHWVSPTDGLRRLAIEYEIRDVDTNAVVAGGCYLSQTSTMSS